MSDIHDELTRLQQVSLELLERVYFAERERDAAEAALWRWQHDECIEGDYIDSDGQVVQDPYRRAEKAEARVDELKQLLSCNDERIGLIVREHKGEILTPHEVARLEVLQSEVARVFPRVTVADLELCEARVAELESDSMAVDDLLRFVDKLFGEQCMVWHGATTKNGYPQIWNGKKNDLAHRWIYTRMIADIPEGFEVDHLCGNKSCVNPKHLEAVTSKTNRLRQKNHNREKTHCKYGHPLSGDNVRVYVRKNGHRNRVCLACKKEEWKRHKARAALDGSKYWKAVNDAAETVKDAPDTELGDQYEDVPGKLSIGSKTEQTPAAKQSDSERECAKCVHIGECIKCGKDISGAPHWVMGYDFACKQCVHSLSNEGTSGGHWWFNAYLCAGTGRVKR